MKRCSRWRKRNQQESKRGISPNHSEFLHFIKMSLDENKAITFPYYFKRIDTFFNTIVLKGTHQSNTVDIFCLDSTELHKAQ
ncbi:MAG: hypothetical protein ACLUHA_12250 [Bacteroides stercoris]